MCAIDHMKTSAEWRPGVGDLVLPAMDRWNFPRRPREMLGRSHDGSIKMLEANWSLVPWWAEDWDGFQKRNSTFNARRDSLMTKPSFQEPFRKRRCLLLATSFVEHADRVDGKSRPVEFLFEDERPYCYAGLWESWGPEHRLSCTMITTEPNELVAPVHSRMPAILDPDDYEIWLDPSSEPAELLAMLEPYPAEGMVMREAVLPPRKGA